MFLSVEPQFLEKLRTWPRCAVKVSFFVRDPSKSEKPLVLKLKGSNLSQIWAATHQLTWGV
jgi:hypothetical protein